MASKVAEALVEIRASNAALRSDLTVTKGLVSGLGSSLTGALRGLAGILTSGLGAVAAALALREMIGASIEAGEAQIRLQAAVNQTGDTIGFTVDQLNAMAKQIQSTTNYGDEAINRAQAILLHVEGMSHDTFESTLNTAKDLAALMGGDIDAAAQTLALSMQMPEAAMRRLRTSGVMFTREQQEQIKNYAEAGEFAKAQAIILEQISATAGGMAEQMANPFAQAKNQLGELAETLGNLLMPVLKPVMNFVQKIAEGLAGMEAGPLADLLKEVGVLLTDIFNLFTEIAGIVGPIFGGALRIALGLIEGIVKGLEVAVDLGRRVALFATGRVSDAFSAGEQRVRGERPRARPAAAATGNGFATVPAGQEQYTTPGDRAMVKAAETITASFSGISDLWRKMQESISQVKIANIQERQLSEVQTGNRHAVEGNDLLRQINAGVRNPRPATAG